MEENDLKTITEMQLQIRNMSTQLDTLATELEQFGKTDKKKSEINFDSIYEIAVRNPITDHYLQEQDISVKKSYLTMLIVLVCMVKQNQENAWILVQRIAIGGGYEESIQKLQVDALSFSDEYLNRFTYDLVEAGVNQAFALDAMLLYLICETPDADMLEFISELLGLLKCDKKQVREITELAKSIIEQNEKVYYESEILNEAEAELLAIAYPYLKEYSKGIILNVGKEKYFLKQTKIGDIYSIGEIDGEPIMWKVIGKENGKTLLLCEQKVSDGVMVGEWENSTIRSYLNSDYLKYFSDNQTANIAINEQEDKVFLLSKNEVEKYLPKESMRTFSEAWGTRSSESLYGIRREYIYVSSSGRITSKETNDAFIILLQEFNWCTRPAFWINI